MEGAASQQGAVQLFWLQVLGAFSLLLLLSDGCWIWPLSVGPLLVPTLSDTGSGLGSDGLDVISCGCFTFAEGTNERLLCS